MSYLRRQRRNGGIGVARHRLDYQVWTRWLEDRTLQAELPGYREYAVRVRYRPISGVW